MASLLLHSRLPTAPKIRIQSLSCPPNPAEILCGTVGETFDDRDFPSNQPAQTRPNHPYRTAKSSARTPGFARRSSSYIEQPRYITNIIFTKQNPTLKYFIYICTVNRKINRIDYARLHIICRQTIPPQACCIFRKHFLSLSRSYRDGHIKKKKSV